jgi:tetratricopeptide (TPR) repeat protein
MKIAFCISGQFRDEEMSFTKTSALAERLGATVFVSTWKKRGTKSSGVIFESQLIRMFGADFARLLPYELQRGRFSQIFPEFERRIAETIPDVTPDAITRYFPNAIYEIEDETFDLRFEQTEIDSNSLRMLYKIWRCNALKREHERRAGQQFDIVVRMRPDVVPMLTPTQLETILSEDLPNSLWTSNPRPSHLGDTLAVTNSALANYYASLFGKAVQSPYVPWRFIHFELHEHIVARGIKIRHIDMEEWITENYVRRQEGNRLIITKMIKDHQFDSLGTKKLESLRRLHPVLSTGLSLCNSILDRGMLSSVSAVIENDVTLLDIAPREVLGFLALALGKLGLMRAWLAAEILSLAAEVNESDIDTQNSELHFQRLTEVYRKGLEITNENIFRSLSDRASLLALLRETEIEEIARRYIDTIDAADFSNALKILDRWTNRIEFQQTAFWHYLRGHLEFDRAREVATRITEDFPDNWIGFDHLGHYHTALGQHQEALACAKAALNLSAEHGGLQMRVGDLLVLLGEHEAAIPYFERATKLWNADICWINLAKVQFILGRTSDARQALQNGLKHFPESRGLVEMQSKYE